MALKRIAQRLTAINSNKLATLDYKAGTTQRVRGRSWMATRREVLLRDGYRCRGCGIVRMDNEVDHIIPLEQGGSNDTSNMQTLCGGPDGCHTRKTVEEAKVRAKG